MNSLFKFFLFLIPFHVFAQGPVLSDIQSSKEIEQLIEREHEELKNGIDLAKKLGWPLQIVTDEGAFLEIVGVTDDGMPKYFSTDNTDAAKTISTNRVHNGGGYGFNLEGQGMTIAEWDGGDVLNTHTELNGRATDRDGANGVHYHACHVAGTMVARGASSRAKGMAPQANLWHYDWNNDDSEMRTAAASGILVSNHSYGQVAGWSRQNGSWRWYGNSSVSSSEDYRFGFYTSDAQGFDQTARVYPYLLIVKSAGNDRNDGPSQSSPKNDPSYGSVHSQAVAKNNLVVASVKDISTGYNGVNSVQMSSYSCWGPTDDGRLKPDISANGEGLYSMWDGQSKNYGTSSGTSMAAPNAAGSALLIQQRYKAVNNSFMKSATLKGLIIHTADEAGGAEGPDYRFGWGLMNTLKAVQAITSSTLEIEEKTLAQSSVNEIAVSASGSRWVRITLCWTDYEGNPVSPQLNPTTKMLRNDLDVRLIHDDNTTYFPYVLNPSLPTANPTKGDNFRDNVEQIYVQVPKAGNYKIRVSHKGNLVTSNQAYSIIYEGFEPPTSVSFTASKKQVCIGDTVWFANTSQASFSSLRWDFAGGHIMSSTASNPYVVYKSSGKFQAKLTLYQGSSSYSGVDSVSVRPGPEVKIVNNQTYCLPNFKYETINATVPTGKWDGYPWMVRSDSCVFRPSSLGSGDFKIKYSVSDLYGCVGSDSSIIKIRNAPQVNLYVQPRVVCQNSAPINLSGGNPTGGVYYVDSLVANPLNPIIYQAGAHVVRYEFGDTSGCVGSQEDEISIDICGSVLETVALDPFQLFPNPTKSKLFISGPVESLEEVTLRNAVGQEIEIIEMNAQGGLIEVQLSNLEKGLYFIELKTEEKIRDYKILKN